MPDLSVIVPIYKVEPFIERCVRSLFEQTLDDIEYVFVDDASPDRSMEILERLLLEYPARKEYVRIVRHQVNKGSAAVRKTGLEHASGEYVIYCDSDDWVEHDMYEKLMFKAREGDCDMVVCGFFISDGKGYDEELPEIKTPESILTSVIRDDLRNYLWNKLIRRSIYDKLEYWPRYGIFEDVACIIPMAFECKSFGVVDEPLYHYFINNGSLLHQKVTPFIYSQMKENLDMALRYLDEHRDGRDFSSDIALRKMRFKLMNFDIDWNLYVKAYPEVNLSLLFRPSLPFSKKLGHLTKLLGVHGLSKRIKM